MNLNSLVQASPAQVSCDLGGEAAILIPAPTTASTP